MTDNFSQKCLRTTIVLNQGTFAGQDQANTITLEGYRTSAVVTEAGGYAIQGSLNLRIWGMRDSLMQQLYRVPSTTNPLPPTAIRLEAAAGDEPYRTVFMGQATSVIPDYNSAPNVSIEIFAAGAGYTQFVVPAANSGKGTHAVADVIEGITRAIGFTFQNHGVTAQITDYNVSGSGVEQIRQLAHAAGVVCQISFFTVRIWPNLQTKNLPVIKLGPDSGLVGYPSLAPPASVNVTCLFNPEIDRGRQVQLDTSLKNLCGTWYVAAMSHELAAEMPGGPWFTHATLLPGPIDAALNGN